MNNRQLLIAGLVIFLVIGADYMFIKHRSVTHPGVVSVISGVTRKSLESMDSQAGNQSWSPSPPSTSAVFPGALEEDIKSRIVTADQILDSAQRNIEYQKLVELAIADNTLDVAVEAAKKIDMISLRDTAYEQIVQQAIKQQDYSLAEKVSREIDGADRKEAALKKLLKADPI